LPIVVLYGLHPVIVLYNAVGMSEIVFFFFMAIAMMYLLRWALGQAGTLALVIIGISLAMCFWVRYEAIALVGAFSAAVVLILYTRTDSWRALWRVSQSSLITIVTPAVYSIFLWIVLNWMILGEPLYWWSGQYSNTAFTEAVDVSTDPYYHNPVTSVLYALVRVQTQILMYPLLIGYMAGIMIVRRTLLPVIPLIIPAAIILFQAYQSFSGASFGWYRFFSYAIICGVIFFFWLLTFLPPKTLVTRILEGLMIVGMLASMGVSVWAMNHADLGKQEIQFMTLIESQGQAVVPERELDAKQVADFIRAEGLEGPILIDTFRGYSIVLFADLPDLFVKTQDRDFQAILNDPAGHGVKWVLVPESRPGDTIADWLQVTYPDLWEDGAPWATLYKDFGAWRLYRVTPS
jgi:hypothetical protein